MVSDTEFDNGSGFEKLSQTKISAINFPDVSGVQERAALNDCPGCNVPEIHAR